MNGQSTISVLLNGAKTATAALTRDEWTTLRLSLGELPLGDVFVCEIQLEDQPATFDDGLFQVRDRRLS